MSELLTLQDLANGHLDVKALGEAANGDENTIVTTRTGKTYPSVKKAVKTLFENGSLPAVPFKTKALMTASSLANDKYAMVTDDTVNNGLYVKTAGAWVKSAYDPLTQSKAYTESSVDILLRKLEGNPIEADLRISDIYSGLSDPKLVDISVGDNGVFAASDAHKSAVFAIPRNMRYLKSITMTIQTFYAFRDVNGKSLGGSKTRDFSGIDIPTGAVDVVIPVKSSWGQQSIGDGVVFSISRFNFTKKEDLVSISSGALEMVGTVTLAEVPKIETSTPAEYEGVLPVNGIKYKLYVGRYLDKSSGMGDRKDSTSLRLAIPAGSTHFNIDMSNAATYGFSDASLTIIIPPSGYYITTKPLKGGLIKIPTNASYLYVNVITDTFKPDFTTASIQFLSDKSMGFATKDYVNTALYNDRTKNMGEVSVADNLYTITGLDFRLFTDSVFSGLHPKTSEHSVEFHGQGVFAKQNKGHYCKILNAGDLRISVYDYRRNVIAEKTTKIHKKPMPTTVNKLSGKSPLQVMFIGDSLIHNNQNAIGKEWLRMINTNNPVEQVIGDVIYPATFNLGDGNIELVGLHGTSENKYTILNTYITGMEGTIGALPESPNTSTNPFIVRDADNDLTLGEDRWLNAVDIADFFERTCGAGKHPDYIYLACGVNDMAGYDRDMDKFPYVLERMIRTVGRMKEACDTLAGGDSDVKILFFNHQFYPEQDGHLYGLSGSWQRRNWAIMYDMYEKAIKNKSYKGKPLRGFVRFVDVASSFDVSTGYTYFNEKLNPRTTKEGEFVVDMVHMGQGGACQNADALLRDFLYHECS